MSLLFNFALEYAIRKVQETNLALDVNDTHQDAMSIVLFNFALEYAIRRVQETNLGLDMNDTHQVLTYADDENLIGDDIKTIERNADELLNACKDIG